MSRRRLTQIFPFLLPLRQWQRKRLFYAAMRLDRSRYAHRTRAQPLPYLVHERSEAMINRASGHPIVYQYNKAHNLRLAAATLDGLFIAPGETFSFWQRVRHGDEREPYQDGLVLQDGMITGAYGGGLCQLSDLLLQLFLRSDLYVIERHPHTTASFAPTDAGEALGVDATVSEGWLDLKACNPTDVTYQLGFSFEGEHIVGTLRSSARPARRYELFNERVAYWRDTNGQLHLSATVARRCLDPATSGPLAVERLFETESLVGYELPPDTAVLAGRPEPLPPIVPNP